MKQTKQAENVHENRTSADRTTILISLSDSELKQIKALAQTSKLSVSKLLITKTLNNGTETDR